MTVATNPTTPNDGSRAIHLDDCAIILRTVDFRQGPNPMAKPHLKSVTPDTENRTVTPTRLPNSAYRTREYLTDAEVARLMDAVKANRWGHRDATMILMGIGTASGLPSWPTCDGPRSISTRRRLRCAGSRRVHRVRIRSAAMNCERCAGCNGSKSRNRRLCSSASAARRSARQALPASWNGLAKPLGSILRRIRTC